jgi:hypothetical protein
MTSQSTEDLIAQLTTAPAAVKPLPRPILRALAFLAAAFALVAAVVAFHGVRHNLDIIMALPWRQVEFAASIITGVLAAIAAFHLAVPGRSAFWALLPAPAALLWLGSLGAGCWSDFVRLGPDGLALGTSWACLKAITLTSIPMGALLFWMLRFAGPVTSLPVALFGTLAVAALSAAGLTLYHHLEAAILVLVWHIGSITLVTLATVASRRMIFRAIGP